LIVGRALQIFAVPGVPEIVEGADLAAAFAEALRAAGIATEAGDVFVVAQKVVSKAEGAIVNLADVTPSDRAAAWAHTYDKDAATVEVVLRESKRIVRMERGVIISETAHGFVCANAGVDSSNVPPGYVTLLPRDPDASAARLCETMTSRLGHPVAVIVADTFGRPWREGVVNVAIGVAGVQPLDDWRGRPDRFGRRMHSTIVAVADEIASAAELVMGKTNGTPLAVVRGVAQWAGDGSAAALVRPAAMDMFR
jgi:coenzyme F420-0:L-glutamate ligase / coenzyme F420-1:gamma-L-glutamate ligase